MRKKNPTPSKLCRDDEDVDFRLARTNPTPRTPVFVSPACIGPERATNPTQTALGSPLSAWKIGRGTFPGGEMPFRLQGTNPSRERARRCCPVNREERVARPSHPRLRTCSGFDGWLRCVAVSVCRVRATAEVDDSGTLTEKTTTAAAVAAVVEITTTATTKTIIFRASEVTLATTQPPPLLI